MNADFFAALADIEREKGIPRKYMAEKIEQALLAALRKDYPSAEENARVVFDLERGAIGMFIQKTAVDYVTDPNTELTLDEARLINAEAAPGDIVNVPVDTGKFGRIAAQAAKQVIIQGIREAERNIIFGEFASKEREIMTALVIRADPKTEVVTVQLSLNADTMEATLPPGEQIPGEIIRDGDRLKVYVVEVKKLTRGPRILISRTHPGLVRRLFEMESPEIYDGTVEIRGVAREPGSRTKLAVASNDPNVEPVGACVGQRGDRVNTIVKELCGEKIDVIKYSENITEYVAAALAPASVLSVRVLPDGKSCRAIVPDAQLSLAIGREGQNVRLAARLTGFKIDIKSQSMKDQDNEDEFDRVFEDEFESDYLEQDYRDQDAGVYGGDEDGLDAGMAPEPPYTPAE
ncbi:MAG: transcription termination factor NusA [Oscillospiraceae bacterium]|jgi:N utilization substance protein A|nr:transcription termination factor NusA [Oscillospiraceae bacterium]